MTAARKLPETTLIALDRIRLDGGTQWRTEISDTTIADYAEVVGELPPIDVFDDGEFFWLVDGFHRHGAFLQAKRKRIPCIVHPGSQRDAVLFSCGVNDKHGLRRKPEEARAAVKKLLCDAEWSKWPQSKIAKHCHVSEMTVSRVKASLTVLEMARRGNVTAERDGKTYALDTSKIGKKKKPEPPPKSEPRRAKPEPQWACPRCGTEYPVGVYPVDAQLCAACAEPGKRKSRPAPEKWECSKCHTEWPVDVEECLECAAETVAEEEEEETSFNGTAQASRVHAFICEILASWPANETFEPLLDVFEQLRMKLTKLAGGST